MEEVQRRQQSGEGVHGSLGLGGKVASPEAGGGSRARLTPVAGPHATESKDCDKKANYPKMWPPDRLPSLLFPELFPLSLKPLAAVVKSPCPHPLG